MKKIERESGQAEDRAVLDRAGQSRGSHKCWGREEGVNSEEHSARLCFCSPY